MLKFTIHIKQVGKANKEYGFDNIKSLIKYTHNFISIYSPGKIELTYILATKDTYYTGPYVLSLVKVSTNKF